MDIVLLFFSAFLAATILPFSSEIVLVALLEAGSHSLLLWFVATSGNTFGAVVNWALGLGLLRFQHRRWFYFTPVQIQRAQAWFDRVGKWSLMFAWLPIVGDGLTLVAGVMRVHFLFFITLVVVGKGLRYAVILLVWSRLV